MGKLRSLDVVRVQVKQNVHRFFDYKRATAMVDAALGLPPVNRP